MLMNTGERAVMSEHGLLTTVGFQLSGEPARYALEGPIFITGAAIEWLEQLSLIEDVAESERLIRLTTSISCRRLPDSGPHTGTSGHAEQSLD
jgi:glycerol kinase